MGKQDLQEFINTKKQKIKESPVNWEQVKSEWLKKLYELYKNIESWLKDFDSIRITYSDIELNEDKIGIYSAKKMIITISDEQVSLEPAGTLLIGAKGRVDIIGKNGRVKIVLVPKDSEGPSIKVSIWTGDEKEEKNLANTKEWTWKLSTRPPVIKYIELDSDSFSDALLEAIGG